MRAQRFRTRAEACLTGARAAGRRRGRRVAARLRRARVGARRFFAIARVRGVPLCPFALRRRATGPSRAGARASRARLPAVAPGHEAGGSAWPPRRSAGGAFWCTGGGGARCPGGAGRSSVARARRRGCGATPRGPRGAPRFRRGAATTPSALFSGARRRSCCGCSPPNAATRRRRRRPFPFPTTIMRRRHADVAAAVH